MYSVSPELYQEVAARLADAVDGENYFSGSLAFRFGDTDCGFARGLYGLVRQFSAYDDEEDILIPHGRYDQFINQVLQWFGKRQIDNSNNNAE